jgi:hypothetical protein
MDCVSFHQVTKYKIFTRERTTLGGSGFDLSRASEMTCFHMGAEM